MTRILLIGGGAFGRVHAAALHRLGIAPAVFDPAPASRAALPGLVFHDTLDSGLAHCDAAIIATPPPTHAALAETALRAGRDLFLEKPATETAAQSRALAELAARTGRIVQVGLYFRFHPKVRALRAMIRAGEFGALHYLSARMSGLKRARGDSGALLNDAVHFVDLIPFLADEAPSHVFATLRDPLGRGREDLAVLQLHFPSGATALIEAGCVIPGEHDDAVVPGAETRKLLAVAGARAMAEIDFMTGRFALRRGAHRPGDFGVWNLDHTPRETPQAASPGPVDVVAAQLAAFLDAVATRTPRGPDLMQGGVAPLRILDAARRSADEARLVAI